MNRNRGFTLVELIIVVAIMAVLTALLAPQYIKYLSESREQVCLTNLDTLQHECYIDLTVNGGRLVDEDMAHDYMNAVLTRHGGVETRTDVYTDVCKFGGEVSILYEVVTHMPYLSCDKHGGVSYDAIKVNLVKLANKMDSVDGWDAYWSAGQVTGGRSIDSTASGGAEMTSKVKTLLETLKIDASESSWRIYGKGSVTKLTTNYILWADDDISKRNIGDTVEVYKYDLLTDTLEKGTVKITQGGTDASNKFKVLGGTFSPAS